MLNGKASAFLYYKTMRNQKMLLTSRTVFAFRGCLLVHLALSFYFKRSLLSLHSCISNIKEKTEHTLTYLTYFNIKFPLCVQIVYSAQTDKIYDLDCWGIAPCVRSLALLFTWIPQLMERLWQEMMLCQTLACEACCSATVR